MAFKEVVNMWKKVLTILLLFTLAVSANGEVSMANKYCNLQGGDKIRDSYTDINTGFDALDVDISALNADISVLDGRVDTIITTPISGEGSAQELIDARGGSATLGARLDEVDASLAEIATEVDELNTNKADKTEVNAVNLRVDNLVIPISPENTNLEVTDAHNSIVKNKNFDSLKERFEENEQDLVDIKNLVNSKPPLGSFEVGRLNSDGVPADDMSYRVRSANAETYIIETTLHVKEGFKFIVYYYANTTTQYASSNSGWVTNSHTIPANSIVRIMIARVAETASEIADVNVFVSNVYEDISSPLTRALNTIKNEDLPLYWKTYLDNKINDINDSIYLIGNHGDYFAWFTDYHVPLNAGYTVKICNYIKENTRLEKVIFGGDILTINDTKDVAVDMISDFVEEFKTINGKILIGNHEYNRYTELVDDYLTADYLYPLITKQYETDPIVNLQSNMYYYVDNSAQKIRYIYLNTNYSATQFLIDLTQQIWLVDTLNDVNEGWYVVLFTHMFYGSVNADFTLTKDLIGERIQLLCEAFQTRGSGSDEWGGRTITYDFTNAKGSMACVITGHTHNDYHEQANGFPIIACVCDAYQGSSQNPAYPRTRGTYTEQAIDLFFIDTIAKTINTIRIGSGNDRTFVFD